MVRVVIPDEIIRPACNFCSNSSRTILIIKLFMPSDIAIWPTPSVAFELKYNLFFAHRFHTRESFCLNGIEERMISNFHINHAKIIFFYLSLFISILVIELLCRFLLGPFRSLNSIYDVINSWLFIFIHWFDEIENRIRSKWLLLFVNLFFHYSLGFISSRCISIRHDLSKKRSSFVQYLESF